MGDEEKKKDVSEFDETLMKTEKGIEGEDDGRASGPYVVIAQGPRQGLRFPLKPGENFVGRQMGSEIMLEDQSVSRRHAKITQAPEGWVVEDAGSKNGTYVNGHKILERVTVGHGDIIQAGIYTLRIITRPVTDEEEVKPLPADWEGKTVMMGAKREDETATMAEEMKKVDQTGLVERGEVAEGVEGVEGGEGGGEIVVPEEISEEEEKKRKRPFWVKALFLSLIVIIVVGALAFAYFQFIYQSEQPVVTKVQKKKVPGAEVQKPGEGPVVPGGEVATPGGQVSSPVEKKTEIPANIPVFLDFASNPLPCKVFFQGNEVGTTPVKMQVKLDIGTRYSAECEFDLKEIGEKFRDEQTFVIGQDESLMRVLFKGPIGTLKVVELPKNSELYLEARYIYDPFKAKSSKMEEIIFGKPVYVPYGMYVIEVRSDTDLSGSGQFTKEIKYRREIMISEDQPVVELKITEADLQEFPVEVISIPTGADVFIDGERVGVTPYKGILPTGKHEMSLRKDGYFEEKKDIEGSMNSLVKLELPLRTTVAGEFINSGKVLMQKGMFKEAIEKLTEVFKNNPTTGEIAQTKYLLGSCSIHLGDLATAESYFQQTLQDDAIKHASQLGLVSVYHGLGRTDEAIPYIVEVFLNSKDEEILKEARALFQQVSPLRSVIFIKSEPEGARVYVDDQLKSDVTPLIIPNIPLGNHKIRIEKDGYLPKDLNKNISVNEFDFVNVKLDPIPE